MIHSLYMISTGISQ